MPGETTLLWLWCATLAPVVYSYLLYPLLIAAIARGRQPPPSLPGNAEALPTVTVLVAAHNEADVIVARIANALACDYPPSRLEVLIVSDGSSDATESLVEGYGDERVRLLALQPNRGKSYALNRAIPEARGDVITMSDANTQFDPQALRRLVSRLRAADRPLAVCGKLVLVDPASGDNVDSLYWRYESWQKKNEGLLAATLGANGGIYAFRRDDYQAIPDNTILDDMTIPLLMKLRIGGRIVFDESALAYEDAAPSMNDEFGRRVRIGIGAFQSLPVLARLLAPRHGFTALAFLSHKILRWLTPQLLLLSMVVTVAGLQYPALRFIAGLYVGAGVAAWLGRRVGGDHAAARLLRLVSMFADMNIALGVGFLRWLTEKQTGTWRRTARGT